MHKIRKIFRTVSEKTALPTNLPTKQPIITNKTDFIGPGWRRSKNMVRKPGDQKLLNIDFIVNIILDYLKKTVHNLFTITTNVQRSVLWKKSSKTFKQSPWKIPKIKFILVKLNWIEFIHMCFSSFLLKVLVNFSWLFEGILL